MIEARLREILEELDVTVVSKSDDGWLRCPCPFAEYTHEKGTDRDPSFFVKSSGKQLSGFHCFTCHEKGRISSLVRKLEHHRNESYGNLAMRADLAETPDSFDGYEQEVEFDGDPTPLDKAAYLTMYPPGWDAEESRAYLIQRGVGKTTTELLQLQYDEEEHRVLFPIFDYKNDLFGFSGRSMLTEEQIDKINEQRSRAGRFVEYSKVKDYAGLPKEKVLLGDNLIQGEKPLLVVEGLFAFAHLVEIGAREICNPVATLGSRMSRYQRDLLIEHNLPVFLCYDNDAPGEDGIYGKEKNGKREGGAYDLLKQHVPTFIPLYPEGINDPDFLMLDDIRLMLRDPMGGTFSY